MLTPTQTGRQFPTPPEQATTLRVVNGLKMARRTEAWQMPQQPSNSAAALGLRFERRVGRELALLKVAGLVGAVEHNPWFIFSDKHGSARCCPDFLLWLSPHDIVVVEVKLTWVPEAAAKLAKLYCPVVSAALACATHSIVLCRNLAPGAPQPSFGLNAAIHSAEPALLCWPNNGRLPW